MSTKKTDEERTLLFVKTFASFTPPAVRRSREKRRHPNVKTAPEKEVALTMLVSREILAKKDVQECLTDLCVKLLITYAWDLFKLIS